MRIGRDRDPPCHFMSFSEVDFSSAEDGFSRTHRLNPLLLSGDSGASALASQEIGVTSFAAQFPVGDQVQREGSRLKETCLVLRAEILERAPRPARLRPENPLVAR